MDSFLERLQAAVLAQTLTDEQKIEWFQRMLKIAPEFIDKLEKNCG